MPINDSLHLNIACITVHS